MPRAARRQCGNEGLLGCTGAQHRHSRSRSSPPGSCGQLTDAAASCPATDNSTFTPRSHQFTLKATPRAPLTPQPSQDRAASPCLATVASYNMAGGGAQGGAKAVGGTAESTVRTRGCAPQRPPFEAPTEPRRAPAVTLSWRGGLQHSPARCGAVAGRLTRPSPPSARGLPPLASPSTHAQLGRRQRGSAVQAEESGGRGRGGGPRPPSPPEGVRTEIQHLGV